jgi:hypothetical protein
LLAWSKKRLRFSSDSVHFMSTSSMKRKSIRTYSLLYWPNVYIPHCGGPFFFYEFGYYTVFNNILTVIFDTFTNNVSFLYLRNLLCTALALNIELL